VTVISSTVLVNGDNNFAGIMPGIDRHAEGRLYRELDLPVVSVIDTSVICYPGVRLINLSNHAGEFWLLRHSTCLARAGATSPFRDPHSFDADFAAWSMRLSIRRVHQLRQPTYFTRLGNTEIILDLRRTSLTGPSHRDD